jgi:hypothetical protein
MTSPVWRKSSWTESGTTSDCVEVAEVASVALPSEATDSDVA